MHFPGNLKYVHMQPREAYADWANQVQLKNRLKCDDHKPPRKDKAGPEDGETDKTKTTTYVEKHATNIR